MSKERKKGQQHSMYHTDIGLSSSERRVNRSCFRLLFQGVMVGPKRCPGEKALSVIYLLSIFKFFFWYNVRGKLMQLKPPKELSNYYWFLNIHCRYLFLFPPSLVRGFCNLGIFPSLFMLMLGWPLL